MESIGFSLCKWDGGVKSHESGFTCPCVHVCEFKCLHLTTAIYSVGLLVTVIFQVLWLTAALPSSSWTAPIKLNIYPTTKFTHHSRLFWIFHECRQIFYFFFFFFHVSLLLYPGHIGANMESHHSVLIRVTQHFI